MPDGAQFALADMWAAGNAILTPNTAKYDHSLSPYLRFLDLLAVNAASDPGGKWFKELQDLSPASEDRVFGEPPYLNSLASLTEQHKLMALWKRKWLTTNRDGAVNPLAVLASWKTPGAIDELNRYVSQNGIRGLHRSIAMPFLSGEAAVGGLRHASVEEALILVPALSTVASERQKLTEVQKWFGKDPRLDAQLLEVTANALHRHDLIVSLGPDLTPDMMHAKVTAARDAIRTKLNKA